MPKLTDRAIHCGHTDLPTKISNSHAFQNQTCKHNNPEGLQFQRISHLYSTIPLNLNR